MKIGVITLFPQFFEHVTSAKASGLIGKAFEEKKAEFFIENLREHGKGKHKVVDDSPYGGGDGMVLSPEPIEKALRSLLAKMGGSFELTKRVFLCPSGSLWTQKRAESLVGALEGNQDYIFLCGRYAGADERVFEKLFDEKISLGPFVLNGGEAASLCIIETLVRLVPGVLGNSDSVLRDSFSKGSGYKIEASSYTRPRVWSGLEVPEVLLSGDHQRIEVYRESEALRKTKLWEEESKKALGGSLKVLK